MPGGKPAILATRYVDVRTILENPLFSRAALSHADPDELVAYSPPDRHADPEHADHSMPYELLNRWFTPRAVERLRPRVRQIAEQLAERMAACRPPANLVAALTARLPRTVIGELAGIPSGDRRWLADRAPLVTADPPTAASRRAAAEIASYFRDALDARRANPPDDLLGLLLRVARQYPDRVPKDKLVPLAMRTCLPAFHSVSVAASKGVPIVLRQPEAYAELGAPDGRVTAIVEEILRLVTPAAATLPRLARADIPLSGGTVPNGSIVVGCLESANTDEHKYPVPSRIVADRGSTDHVTFGRGPNFCFGAALSRMELQELFAALARRFPKLRLDMPEHRLPARTGVIAPDIVALPVRWQP